MHTIETIPSYAFVRYLNRVSDVPEVGDVVEVYGSSSPSVAGHIVEIVEENATIEAADGTRHTLDRFDCYVQDRASIRADLEAMLHSRTPDGVAWVDGTAPALRERLSDGFDILSAGEPDYHPGSGTIVRDLVHPSLYPHVTPAVPAPPSGTDRWGRPFESSRCQWLPTPFVVSEDGGVSIQGAINNLPRAGNAGMYAALEALFVRFLPLFESVYGYTEGTRFFSGAQVGEAELPNEPVSQDDAPAPRSLRGRTLQVITKIVEYRLDAGEAFEGVWHVEGMSHEHILATGVYVLSRDEALSGGTLRFKRPYTLEEAGLLFWRVPQSRPAVVDSLVREGLVPIGSLETPADRLLVFPNSHVHKLSTMSVAEGADEARRRVIVFWLVDPAHTIPSTASVRPPQESMSRKKAIRTRLALMEERRLHKQTLNVRAVSLCEH